MDILTQLQRDEGFVPHVYVDTVGKKTIGFGHNLDAKPISWIGGSTVITRDQGIVILTQDIADTWTGLQKALPWVRSLDAVRSGVLTNMAFNMGVPGLTAFHHNLAAFQAGDWIAAAAGMRNSAWYVQVGVRARRLVDQVLTGVWQ